MTETTRKSIAGAHLAAAKSSRKLDDLAAMRGALERLGRAPDRTAALLFDAAAMYAEAGATEDAVRSYLEAGTAFIDPEAELGRAREAFDAAHALDPVNLDVIFQIGRVHMIEGDAQRALAQFVHVLRHSKYTHAPALFEAACVYEQLGLHEQAVLTFRKVLDRDRANVPAIVRMGQRLHSMGMLPEAIGYYMQAAEVAYAAGQIGTCRHVINLVLGLDPNNHRARSVLHDLNEAQAAALEPVVEAPVPPAIAEPAPPALEREPPPVEAATPPPPVEVVTPLLEVVAPPPPSDAATRLDVARLAAKYDKVSRKVDDVGASVAALEETIARLQGEIAALAPKKPAPKVVKAATPTKSAKPAKPAKPAEPVKPKPRKK